MGELIPPIICPHSHMTTPHTHSTATATVMVYASDTLFIASGSTIHSIPSQFTSVPSDRSLFVGQQQVTDICRNDPSIAIEDMTVTSIGAQPLPRKSHNYYIADLLTVWCRWTALSTTYITPFHTLTVWCRWTALSTTYITPFHTLLFYSTLFLLFFPTICMLYIMVN